MSETRDLGWKGGMMERRSEFWRAKELHFAQNSFFLNLPQVGAIKCNWYRIRPVEGGNFHRKKLSNCGMVRCSEYFGLLPRSAWREGRKACCVKGAKCQSVRAHIGGNPAVTSVTTPCLPRFFAFPSVTPSVTRSAEACRKDLG